ncbi:MAG TPA: YhjD/YihY/BrkB family envelope integrity protein [Anaeromyxobacteraceae bacterium]|nr:YhjD/YihY/BrkB family envelope integrity protein [Anaeromyxobacteraceae bacterium]
MSEKDRRRPGERLERLVQLGRVGFTSALRMLEGESVRLRAMALTYTTLFALVPALVVAFSVVQAFAGQGGGISERIHEFLIENLAVGARSTLEPYLDKFIANAHLASAGLVGGALLVYSGISLFSDVETAINDIWSIRRRRPLRQQVVTYWVGLTLGPLLLAASVMASHAAKTWLAGSGVRFLGGLAGVLLTCAFFTVIYYIVPATKVQLNAAAIGGLLAGVSWEVAKWAYAIFVARSVRYHAIYGSVAAIPIFLLWLYLSWTLMLFGAKVAFIVQHASALLRKRPLASTQGSREILAGEAMLRIARCFDRGDPPPAEDEIASDAQALAEDVGEALAALRQAGLVTPTAEGGLVPSRSLDRISLLHVRTAVQGPGSEAPDEARVGRILKDVEDEAARRLSRITFQELVASAEATEGASGAVPDAENPLPSRP